MNIKKCSLKVMCAALAGTMFASTLLPSFATEAVVTETPMEASAGTSSSDTGWTTEENSFENIKVTYQQSSSYTVTIPKTIALDTKKQASYSVKVSGDIDANQRVYVAPLDGIADSEDLDFYMKDLGGKKADVAATVTQNKVYWNSEDVENAYEENNNSVSAPNLTAGTWEGTFQIEIRLETENEQEHIHNYVDGICTECGEKEPVAYKEFVLTSQNYTMAGISRTGVVEIPSEFDYNGVHYRTVEIGASAFRDCNDLTNITIPDSVANIENLAFSGCTNLSSINIPDSVTHIGYGAFSNCTSLERIEIPDSVISFDGGTFDGETFDGCSKLKSVKLPANMTYIPRAMFRGCTSLTNITIPDSVTSINNGAFQNCTSLTNIIIPNGVTSIGLGTFDGGVFEGCTSLTSITIPDSVTHIGAYAFSDCTKLSSITIPDSVTDIEFYAFQRCTSLTSITIPSSITSIEGGVFNGCTSLTSITIPDSIISIGSRAFQNCTSLKTIYIPSNVTTISASSISDVPFRYLSALKIYCGASEKQSGWSIYWNYSAAMSPISVTYGVTRADYEANYK